MTIELARRAAQAPTVRRLREMISRRAMVLAGFLTATAGLSACDTGTGPACTLIGCSDGLAVAIRGLVGREYDVEVTDPDGETLSGTCVIHPEVACRIQFEGFAPERVIVRVAGGTQEVSVTLEPAYEIFQPNGPDCEPTCRQSTIVIDLRQSAQQP
jgi:hypothetical protein